MNTTKLVVIAILFNTTLFGQTLKDAINKTENERFAQATIEFNKLIATLPNNGSYHFYAGENYFAKGEQDSAVAEWNKAYTVEPTAAISIVSAGKAAWVSGDQAKAKILFAQALKVSKNKNAEIMRCIATTYITSEKKDLDEAIRILTIATKIDAKNEDGHLLMGDALNLKTPGDGSPAIKSYNMVLTINPKSPRGIVRTAKLYQRAKNYDLANEKYKEAQSIDSTYAPAYRENAELNMMFNQSKKAIENWKKYLSLNNTYESRYRYATALFNGKQYCEAIPELLDIQKNSFNNFYIERMLTYSYYECATIADGPVQGLKSSAAFFAIVPAEKVIYLDYKYKGLLLSKNSQDSLAIIEIEKASMLNANAAIELASDLAKLCFKTKQYDKAIAAYELKITKDKLTVAEYFDLGKAYYFGPKNYIAADSAFAKVNKLSSKYVGGYLWMARTKLMQDPEKTQWLAFDAYNTILTLVPTAEERATDKTKNTVIEACKYLGDYYVNSPAKNAEKAKECWTIVHTLNPDDKQAKAFLGIK